MQTKKGMKTIQLSKLYTLHLGQFTYQPKDVLTVIDWLADLLVKEGKATHYVPELPHKPTPESKTRPQ